ncbi:MAG: helix-turn-helix transcriptional regulator [Candidatus Helarchaeota archaeon]
MWLGKFLDLDEDFQEFSEEFRKELFKSITKPKLTPLEFTILESIYHSKQISGYDLIQNLNKHFAGTWEARSGTIYPILSKLKREGFLNAKKVKSPLGPLKKVYSLTEAGEKILKIKVNKNFSDQIRFIENFLIELSLIYIQSFPEDEERKKQCRWVQKLLRNMLENIIIRLNSKDKIDKWHERNCPGCNATIYRHDATFCPLCGTELIKLPI